MAKASKSSGYEIRFLQAEFRMEQDASNGLTLVGRVACYNSLSEPLPLDDSDELFREVIMPGAFTRTLAAKPDCRLLINHDGLPLARTASGTMSLAEDSATGLSCRASLDPSNPRVQEAQSALKRGDVTQMSFAFQCKEQNWRRDDSGQLIRELRDIELHDGDCSIVTYPAYKSTSVGLRNLDEANRSYQEFRSRQPAPIQRGMGVQLAQRILVLTGI